MLAASVVRAHEPNPAFGYGLKDVKAGRQMRHADGNERPGECLIEQRPYRFHETTLRPAQSYLYATNGARETSGRGCRGICRPFSA